MPDGGAPFTLSVEISMNSSMAMGITAVLDAAPFVKLGVPPDNEMLRRAPISS